MPEFPDLEAYRRAIRGRILNTRLAGFRLGAPHLLRSVAPTPEELVGRRVTGVRRIGKQIVVEFEEGFFFAVHLMIAGRLSWVDAGRARKPVRVSPRGTLAEWRFAPTDSDGPRGGALRLRERSRKKRATIRLGQGAAALAALDRGGLEIPGSTPEAFAARLTDARRTLKRALTEPARFAGIGNAYSDEILHRARLSPMKPCRNLGSAEIARLHEATVAVLTGWAVRLAAECGNAFPTRVTAFRKGMAVHGRFGKPCPDCGTSVARVRRAENEFNYCPRCQTGGRLLRDRGLSRLLKKSWPRTVAAAEARRARLRPVHSARPMIPLAQIEAARRAIAPFAVRTPLVRLPGDGPDEVWLKLENLQPFASFKVRGAAALFATLGDEELRHGVMTASAGNWAQAVAFMARQRGVPCTVVVPETSPENKRQAIAALGGEIVVAPFADWWEAIVSHRFPGVEARFVHPVEEVAVMAGNGTVGLEILEDLPDVEAVLVPFGGGGLSCGIASALRQSGSSARVHPVEVSTSAKVAAAADHGAPQWIETSPSFVDGIGGNTVLDPMWPLVSELLAEPLVAAPDEVAEAVRVLAARSRVVAEGAGACPVAVALGDRVPRRPGEEGRARRLVCVVSGGNIEMGVFRRILAGETPTSAR